MFVAGIQNGNLEELQGISSKPIEENCFILDHFQSFGKLSKKCLHHGKCYADSFFLLLYSFFLDFPRDLNMTRGLEFCDHLCDSNVSKG